MSKICDETYPKTTAALISIVQEIRNLNPDAQIILVGYTNPVPLIPCWRSYFNKLNKFEKQIAKTYNLTYVAIPNTETTIDVHPTIKATRHRQQARERHREPVINKYSKAPVSSWKRGLFPTIRYAARAFLMFSKTVSLSSQQTMTTSPVGTVATRAAEAIWYWSSR